MKKNYKILNIFDIFNSFPKLPYLFQSRANSDIGNSLSYISKSSFLHPFSIFLKKKLPKNYFQYYFHKGTNVSMGNFGQADFTSTFPENW